MMGFMSWTLGARDGAIFPGPGPGPASSSTYLLPQFSNGGIVTSCIPLLLLPSYFDLYLPESDKPLFSPTTHRLTDGPHPILSYRSVTTAPTDLPSPGRMLDRSREGCGQ